jgi:acetyltransferase-like isoleucine patch superfamily enzyme
MVIRKISSAFNRLYNYNLRRQGARITLAFRCSVGAVEGMPEGLHALGSAICERGARFVIGLNNNGSPGQLEIGDRFYINRYSMIDCHYSIKIGKNVQIGPLCYITDFDHAVTVDPNPDRHRSDKTYKAVVIRDNAWIGAGCTILKGVTIGLNSVVGAGSVIIKDIPDNTVVAGNPQRLIRHI